MLELQMESCFTFKKVAEAFKNFNSQITFFVDSRGVRSTVPDGCKVALAVLFIPSSMFLEYRYEQEYEFTLKTDLLLDSLKNSDYDEVFTIRMENPRSDRINFEFKNDKNRTMRRISTKLLNGDTPFVPREDIKYTSVIRMQSAELLKKMTRFHACDNVRIKTSLKVLEFSGQNDQQTITESLEPGDDGLNSSVSIEQRSEVDAQFSVKYLTNFVKCSGLSEMVECQFSCDAVCVKYEIGDDDGYMKFYLSPQIEDDEDDEME